MCFDKDYEEGDVIATDAGYAGCVHPVITRSQVLRLSSDL